MKTKNSSVMIISKPLDKWNIQNRATETNPSIATKGNILMTTKLRRILREHGECVSLSNSLVLEILNGYISKSAKLKKAEREIAMLKAQLAKEEK